MKLLSDMTRTLRIHDWESWHSPPDYHGLRFSRPVILILILGFAVRLFACQFVSIINPDGAIYIHQARAITFRQWDELISCSMTYLSIFPVLISATHALLQDWIMAARTVSLLFGTLVLIPLYLLVRRFFDEQISTLTTLIFALMPFLVDGSADVVRGPVYWFFSAMGLFLFICHMDGEKQAGLLIGSSLCFLLAFWARVEAVLFIVVSFAFLLTAPRERKGRNLFFFLGPVAGILIPVIVALSALGFPLRDLLRAGEIFGKLYSPFIEYGQARDALAALAGQPSTVAIQNFLKHSRHLLWFVAMGTLLSHVVKAFFYPFCLVFVVGVFAKRSRMREDRRVKYLALLSACALVVLYFHILQTWVITTRFFALFVLPSTIFLGFGLERIIGFVQSRWRLKKPVVLSVFCCILLAFGLGKDLKARETDKLVFKEIGQFIAQREGNKQVNKVASSLETIRWISFFANLDYHGATCPENYSDKALLSGDSSYEHFVRELRGRGIKYFLWVERQWPSESFDFMKQMDERDFLVLGIWCHTDTGKMVLFKVL